MVPAVNVAAVGAPAAPSRHRDDFVFFYDVGPRRDPLAASARGRVSTTTRPMTPREIERRQKRLRFHDDFLHQESLKRGRGGLEKLLREAATQAYGDARHSLGLGYDQHVWLR